MKFFCVIVACFISFLEVSAQEATSPGPDNAGKPKAILIGSSRTETNPPNEERKDYPAAQLLKDLEDYKQEFQKITVKGILDIDGLPGGHVLFRDVVFDGEVKIRGRIKSIRFDHCQFKQNVTFFRLDSDSLMISNSSFAGSVWFSVKVKNFELRKCEFEKIVDFGGTNFQWTYTIPDDPKVYKSSINMTKLLSSHPIRIDWGQFGERWLEGLKEAAGLPETDERKLNLIDIQRELEFWKHNFNELGHERDANKVNYEINWIGSIEGIRMESWWDRWITRLLSLPNGYGTAPYRPLIVGSLLILIFGVIYRITDPFVPEEDVKTPKPRTPLFLFSLMYSIDTFIPVIDVTKVRDWGWQASPSFRWVTVTERLLGLAVFYSATYSLAYYIF